LIPEQLQNYELIRVCRPDCKTHEDCSSPGKRPVTSVEDRQKAHAVKKWVLEGGNYGVPAHEGNDLVIFDVDDVAFERVLNEFLPEETFSVISGGPGFGKHRYYRCWNWNRNTDFKEPEGSIRATNWHVVGPMSEHESGGRYEIENYGPIKEVATEDISKVVRELEDRNDRNDGESVNSGGGARGGYSHNREGPLSFVRREDRRRELRSILEDTNPSHSERLWFVGFLHSACGLREREITELILKEAPWGTDKEITRTQVEGVTSGNVRGTHYSNYSSDDVVSTGKETTEDHYFPDGVSMSEDAEFNTKEEVTILEGTEAGHNFKSVALVEGSTDEETWEYVSMRRGRVKEQETVDGDKVLAKDVENQSSLGVSPENIPDLVDALEELHEQIEE
jgi:hypothetical protein